MTGVEKRMHAPEKYQGNQDLGYFTENGKTVIIRSRYFWVNSSKNQEVKQMSDTAFTTAAGPESLNQVQQYSVLHSNTPRAK